MRRRPRVLSARGEGPVRASALASLAALALASALLAGCAAQGPVRPQPGSPATPAAPRPRPAAGYVARRDPLPAADATLLAGRRVVLDPGHGGFFKGSIGVHGTTEASVNLGVALVLDSLLRERGADVLMIRSTDRDFVAPDDSTLKHDLAERVKLANAFHPDLFVSIHHNADPGGLHDVNETQTYYQLGDDGPSYDAGTDVHRALARNLGIETQKLLPGNFAVVRGSEAPALLTEASYLTNPDVEARLVTPEARRIEAEALLIGITRFFARRSPAIERFAIAHATPERDAWHVAGGLPFVSARVRGPFDELVMRIDGETVAPLVVGDSIAWRPAGPLASGMHEATLRARLAGEGSSRLARLPFRIVKPFERILADFPGQALCVRNGLVALRVRALDPDGLPLDDDSLAVRVRAKRAAPKDTVLWLKDGVAWGYFRHAPGKGKRALPGNPEFHVAREGGGAGETSGRPADVTLELPLVDRDAPLLSTRIGIARAMPGDTALRNAPGTNGAEPAAGWINRDGFVAIRTDSMGRAPVPRLPGYRAFGADSTWPPRLVAIANGAFTGRHIVLDPEGGGDDAAGVGPSGTRAATLNLEVARALAGMLTASGAEVLMTRDGDAAVSEVERVQRGETFHPDRYLRIGHAAAPPIAGHYFSSSGGRRWGQRLASACARLGITDSLAVGEVAKYAITQTSAVALYASLARVDSAAQEARLLAPGSLRAEAYALWLALAEDLANAPAARIEVADVRDGAGAPIPAALVTAGGALVLQADARGRVRVARTEPGPIELRVADPRAVPRSVLVDSRSSRVPSGPR